MAIFDNAGSEARLMLTGRFDLLAKEHSIQTGSSTVNFSGGFVTKTSSSDPRSAM